MEDVNSYIAEMNEETEGNTDDPNSIFGNWDGMANQMKENVDGQKKNREDIAKIIAENREMMQENRELAWLFTS